MTAQGPSPRIGPDPGADSAALDVAPGVPQLKRIARALGIALVVIDFGSLGFLLWTLEIAWYLAMPLGVGIGWFTAYELQWHFLVSPKAYRAAGSKARFLAAAVLIVIVNLVGGYLLLMRLWYTYLAMRIVAALLGAWAWARWQVRRARRKAGTLSPA